LYDFGVLPIPAYTPLPSVAAVLRERGFALVAARDLAVDAVELAALAPSWDDLPADPHLRDSGRYRFRRHASFVVDHGLHDVAPRAHFQPVEYNALHGGIERWFAPMTPAVTAAPAFRSLVAGLGELVAPTTTLYVEAHQFRIDTASGIGRPTPEGAHRDGVDFVALMLVQRHHVKGGETRVFEADGPGGVRFTMAQPFSVLLLDDARVIHETTPIQPDGPDGVRDTLVITYRRNGFLNR